jgi:hypothetical protein
MNLEQKWEKRLLIFTKHTMSIIDKVYIHSLYRMQQLKLMFIKPIKAVSKTCSGKNSLTLWKHKRFGINILDRQ